MESNETVISAKTRKFQHSNSEEYKQRWVQLLNGTLILFCPKSFRMIHKAGCLFWEWSSEREQLFCIRNMNSVIKYSKISTWTYYIIQPSVQWQSAITDRASFKNGTQCWNHLIIPSLNVLIVNKQRTTDEQHWKLLSSSHLAICSVSVHLLSNWYWESMLLSSPLALNQPLKGFTHHSLLSNITQTSGSPLLETVSASTETITTSLRLLASMIRDLGSK